MAPPLPPVCFPTTRLPRHPPPAPPVASPLFVLPSGLRSPLHHRDHPRCLPLITLGLLLVRNVHDDPSFLLWSERCAMRRNTIRKTTMRCLRSSVLRSESRSHQSWHFLFSVVRVIGSPSSVCDSILAAHSIILELPSMSESGGRVCLAVDQKTLYRCSFPFQTCTTDLCTSQVNFGGRGEGRVAGMYTRNVGRDGETHSPLQIVGVLCRKAGANKKSRPPWLAVQLSQ